MNGLSERKTEKPSVENSGEPYCKSLAARYRRAKYVLCAVLAVFLAAMLIFGRGELKKENFAYFFRSFDSDMFGYSEDCKTIAYHGNADTRFAVFGGDLLVFGDGEFALYGMNGKELISSRGTDFDAFDASGKYLAVYRIGGKAGKLYSSISEVYEINSEYPITDICVGADGGFAVSAEGPYGTEVSLYSPDFFPANSFSVQDESLICTELSEDGERIGIFAFGFDDGGIFSEAVIKSTSDGDTVYNGKFYGESPLCIYFHSDGNASLLTNGALRTINRRGRVTEEIVFSEKVAFAASDGKNTAVCLKNMSTAEMTVQVFSSYGRKTAEYILPYGVYKMYMDDSGIYLLSQDKVFVCKNGAEPLSLPGGSVELFRLPSGKFVLCFTDRAEIYERQ